MAECMQDTCLDLNEPQCDLAVQALSGVNMTSCDVMSLTWNMQQGRSMLIKSSSCKWTIAMLRMRCHGHHSLHIPDPYAAAHTLASTCSALCMRFR